MSLQNSLFRYLKLLELFLVVILVFIILIGLVLITATLSIPLELPEIVVNVTGKVSNMIPILTTIVASTYAIAVPISIQIISSKVDPIFSNKELAEEVFEKRVYKQTKLSAFILGGFAIVSWLGLDYWWLNSILLFSTLWSLRTFWLFLKHLEEVVSDFSGLVYKSNTDAVDRIYE